MEQKIRPRRLRSNAIMRDMVRETRWNSSQLIYPLFVRDGQNICEPIASMPGQKRYSVDRLPEILDRASNLGISGILYFGIPDPYKKDEIGSEAWNPDGAVQRAVRLAKQQYPNILAITDVCMCEYTSHGHCGVLENNTVNNDKTLPLLVNEALSHVQAGADIVAPSDMMDRRVHAIRGALDQNGYEKKAIMSYAVKYASAFYGPFREAADSAPSCGDRKQYQMDPANVREGIKEALLDIEEGADILMVKPAMPYLDVIRSVKERTLYPLAAYQVSGEYAMIKAAGQQSWIDEQAVMCEAATSIFRAGADILITYYAFELAEFANRGNH